MSKANLARKQALLSAEASTRYESHMSRLLTSYAGGESVRDQVANNIVAEFRPVLRANGPNFDGPLFQRITDALEAAEKYGEWKAKSSQPTATNRADS